MRRLGRPALSKFDERLRACGSPRAAGFMSILLRANSDFLAYALSRKGPLARYAGGATPERVEVCLGSMLIFATNLFARDEMRNEGSGLVGLLAGIVGWEPKQVMLRRDNLRKAPRSEEWMLYSWLVMDLGGERPAYDAELERSFGYNYLSYIGQFRAELERAAAQPK